MDLSLREYRMDSDPVKLFVQVVKMSSAPRFLGLLSTTAQNKARLIKPVPLPI